MTQDKNVNKGLSRYEDSGVDVEKADNLAGWLKADQSNVSNTLKSGLGSVTSGIGGFAGAFRFNFTGMTTPELVACTDGVGTKLLLALDHESYGGLGHDLVGMCVNDLYCVGARPLFFIDYYATGVLSDVQFKSVLGSIQSALQEIDCALLGGETAELPGLYDKNHFDLAGFVVGVVDAEKKLPHLEKMKVGDKIVALTSSGFHSNGYSLLRKWLKEKPSLCKYVPQLLEPTRLYHALPGVLEKIGDSVKGISNITGGGISGNLVRALPDSLSASIDKDLLPTPSWMKEFIQEAIDSDDILSVESVFNLGVGMTVVLDAASETQFIELCENVGLGAVSIGHIIANQKDQERVQWT